MSDEVDRARADDATRGSGTAGAIVRGVYRQMLHRDPDSEGLQAYADLLCAGALSPADLIADVTRSTEYLAHRTFSSDEPDAALHETASITFTADQARGAVSQAYRVVLQREPDTQGLDAYVDLLVRGMASEAEIAEDLTRSAEYLAQTPAPPDSAPKGMDDEQARQAVIEAYRNILRREPDPQGLAEYTERLCQGVVSPAGLEGLLIRSAEYMELAPPPRPQEAEGAQGGGDHTPMPQASAYRAVFDAYQRILARDPDDEGLATYIEALVRGQLSTAELRDILEASPERLQVDPRRAGVSPSDAGRLHLDVDYAAEPDAWNAYLGSLFARNLHDQRSGARPSMSRLRVMLEVEADDPVRLDRSLYALAALERAAEFAVETTLIWRGVGDMPESLAAIQALDAPTMQVVQQRRECLVGLNDADVIMWLRSGDAPRPEMAPALMRHVTPETRLLSFDGYLHHEGRIHPVLHPGANPIHAMNADFLFSRLAMRAEVMHAVGLPADGDLIEMARAWLTRSETLGGWTHIPLPLLQLEVSPRDIVDAREALISERKPCAMPRTGRDPTAAKVDVVICTKDKGHLLQQLVRSLLGCSAELISTIYIVHNNSTNLYAKMNLADLGQLGQVEIARYDQPFNFSVQSNAGGHKGAGDYILMLNDDIAPITADWLDRLLDPFADPDVGVTGPLLLYPNERVQHAGMFLGFQGSAGHILRSSRLPEQDYMFYASAPREVSVVTGAVMLMSRACFEALNGFDELLASYLQDVDLCLRAQRSGFKIVFTPASRLIHMESASIGDYITDHAVNENRGREHAYFSHRWGAALNRDDFHSPLFWGGDESLKQLWSG